MVNAISFVGWKLKNKYGDPNPLVQYYVVVLHALIPENMKTIAW